MSQATTLCRSSARRAILARHAAGVATAARLVGCCTASDQPGQAGRLFDKLARLIDLLGPACCGQPWGRLVQECRRLFEAGERLAVRGDLARLAKQMRAARDGWPTDEEPIDLALVPNEP